MSYRVGSHIRGYSGNLLQRLQVPVKPGQGRIVLEIFLMAVLRPT